MPLRVTIEYIPGGNEARKETLAVVSITNVSDLAPISDYVVQIVGTGQVDKVRAHHRANGFWPLVHTAIGLLRGPVRRR
jgi:hypothetical protein